MKQCIKETRSYHHAFLFFMCDDLSFINNTQNTFKPSEENVSMPRMDEKELHTWEFQLKRSSRNIGCKLLQKRCTGKTTGVVGGNLLEYIKLDLKYIKLVIPKNTYYIGIMQF